MIYSLTDSLIVADKPIDLLLPHHLSIFRLWESLRHSRSRLPRVQTGTGPCINVSSHN